MRRQPWDEKFRSTAESLSQLSSWGPAGDQGFPQHIKNPVISCPELQAAAEVGEQSLAPKSSCRAPIPFQFHAQNWRVALQCHKINKIPGFQMKVFSWARCFAQPVTSAHDTGEQCDAPLKAIFQGRAPCFIFSIWKDNSRLGMALLCRGLNQLFCL